MESTADLYYFAKALVENTKNIIVSTMEIDVIEEMLNSYSSIDEKILNKIIIEIKRKTNIDLSIEQAKFSYLATCFVSWKNPETFELKGYLDGGFCFNGLTDIFTGNLKFWKNSIDDFLRFENSNLVDLNLLKDLRWFESPLSPISADYSPQFGCVKLQPNKLPEDFYFYDSGLVYPLPFKSFDEYINALIASGSVTSWQYFYIDPELIIKKNKGLNYLTWSKYTISRVVMNIQDGHDKGKYDRLDIINEYLEKCTRRLPQSFPFLDFSFHIQYYEKFKELYNKS